MNNNINNNEEFPENQYFNSSNFSKIYQDFFFSFEMGFEIWERRFSYNELSNFSVCKKGLQGIQSFQSVQKKKKSLQNRENIEDKKNIEGLEPSRIDVADIHDQYINGILYEASEESLLIGDRFCDAFFSFFQQKYDEIHESKKLIEDQCGLKKPLYQIHPEMDKACNLRIYHGLEELKSLAKQRIRELRELLDELENVLDDEIKK
jgi:hypothetical protein